jgi:hypothetical protein
MIEEALDCWKDFEERVREIRASREVRRREGHAVADMLFRGQSNSAWHLDTSLERNGCRNEAIRQYYALVHSVLGRIETFTGKSWEKIPPIEKFVSLLGNHASLGGEDLFPAFQYMVYLRHHGFPSPLLDWTMSPYIAAYFAFRAYPGVEDDRVTIYVYIEHEGIKGWTLARPTIRSLGPYVRSDQRHFLQQCQYTICYAMENEQLYFRNHEDAMGFELNEVNRTDRVWKFSLPARERNKVLEQLETYNINAYSLFGSEDSLMEAVFLREHLSRLDEREAAEQAKRRAAA